MSNLKYYAKSTSEAIAKLYNINTDDVISNVDFLDYLIKNEGSKKYTLLEKYSFMISKADGGGFELRDNMFFPKRDPTEVVSHKLGLEMLLGE